MNFNHTEEECKFKEITENPIVLDFTDCKYLGEIHKILKTKFGLPEYYGENPDALWDCLRYLFYDEKIFVKIYGLNNLEEELKKATMVLLEVLDDVAEETPNFSYAIIS